MKHLFPSLLVLPAAVAGAFLWTAPAAAQTDCQPDDLFCAEVRIGPGRGSVRVGPAPQPAPPPPPVVVQPQPAPPPVIVQPAPPPPVVVQPQPTPPTVIVQPAPAPPTQVVQPPPPPAPVIVQQRRVRVRQQLVPDSERGLHLQIGGLFGDRLSIGGAGGAFRVRPTPHLALDIGAGAYGGHDYNDLARLEVPVTVDALLFFNPQHRFAFYAVAGVGVSFAHAEGRDLSGFRQDRDYAYLGGQLGGGVEWRISRVWALNFDVRGFMRQRVDDNPVPEFVEAGRSTDTSGGAVGQLGMTFYFQ